MRGKVPPPEVAAICERCRPLPDRGGTVDGMTVRFVSAQPDPTPVGRISRHGSEVHSEEGCRAAESRLAQARKPAGGGPCRVVGFEDDDILRLEAFDDHGAPPPIKELRFVVAPEVASRVKGPLSDECDVIADVPPDRIEIVEAAEGFQVVGGPIADLRLMVFDKTDGAMRDPLARRSPGTEREDRESDAAPDGASRPDRGFRRRRARRARAARGRPDAGAGPDAGPRRRIRWRQVDRPARGAGAARGARSRSGLRDVRGARAGGDAG